MKRLIRLSIFILLTLLYCSSLNPENAGTTSEIKSGTIYGMVICENDTLKEEVIVELYIGDTVPNTSKRSVAASNLVDTDTTRNLEYCFDSLNTNVYSLRALQHGVEIGKKEGISLIPAKPSDSLRININVVIIIQQTFFITTDKSSRITINNFYINNTPVTPDTAGNYPATFAGTDTQFVTIDYVNDGLHQQLQGLLIKKADGTYQIESIDTLAPIIIVLLPDTARVNSGGLIVGFAAHQNGDKAIGTKVIVRHQAGLAATGTWKRFDSTVTSAAGVFSVNSVDTGTYFVEVNDHDYAGALVQGVITNGKPVCSLPTIILKPFGAIKGRLPISLMTGYPAWVQIRELNRFAPINDLGFFSATRIPEGTYMLNLVRNGQVVASYLDTMRLVVSPGDTTVLPGFINHAPVFTTMPTQMTATVEAESLYCDTVHATDANHDAIKFSFIDSAAGMELRDSIILWTPQLTDIGNVPVGVQAIDAGGLADTLNWLIAVKTVKKPDPGRKTITINPPTPMPGYQVRVVLTRTTFDFSHSYGRGSDIRFWKDSATTCPYWIAGWDSLGGKAEIWVRVPDQGTKQLTMTYQKTGISPASDFNATFDAGNMSFDQPLTQHNPPFWTTSSGTIGWDQKWDNGAIIPGGKPAIDTFEIDSVRALSGNRSVYIFLKLVGKWEQKNNLIRNAVRRFTSSADYRVVCKDTTFAVWMSGISFTSRFDSSFNYGAQRWMLGMNIMDTIATQRAKLAWGTSELEKTIYGTQSSNASVAQRLGGDGRLWKKYLVKLDPTISRTDLQISFFSLVDCYTLNYGVNTWAQLTFSLDNFEGLRLRKFVESEPKVTIGN